MTPPYMGSAAIGASDLCSSTQQPGVLHYTLDRGHIEQIRPRVSSRLFLKSIYPKDFKKSLVSSVGRR